MINLETIDIKALTDAETTTKRTSTTDGGNYAGQCPVCGDKDDFYVLPEHIGIDGTKRGQCACRECHPKRMDAIGYLMWARGMQYGEALKYLHEQYGLEIPEYTGTVKKPAKPATPKYNIKPLPMNAQAPSKQWQARAMQAITRSQELLWHEEVGKQAREYLHGRGLTDDTIKFFGLGYVAEDTYDDPTKWNLNPADVEKVYIPKGILIPYLFKDEVWKIRVRRIEENIPKDKRYRMISGSSNGLFNADSIISGEPVALYEGEIDAMSGAQETEHAVVCVATGSTSHARITKWAMLLARASHVLRVFDPDKAGSEADQYWASRLQHSSNLAMVPGYHDTNEMLVKGVNVGVWLIGGLPDTMKIPVKIPNDTIDTKPAEVAQVPAQVEVAAPVEAQPAKHVNDIPVCELCGEMYDGYNNGMWLCGKHWDESVEDERRQAIEAAQKAAVKQRNVDRLLSLAAKIPVEIPNDTKDTNEVKPVPAQVESVQELLFA